ncbi:DUF1559 domain-containing protein [bacterium]|nr:DUF1559 domain-containing protein [bacterium]
MRTLQTRRGITIWEALLIVFIVLVLAAILYPAFFARTSDSARKESCQNNLKSLAVALLLYCQDYDGQLPSSALVNHSKKWNRSDFLKFTKTTGTLPPTSRPRTYVQVIYDHIRYKDRDIWHCPSDSVYPTDKNAPCSYWWKLAVDKAWYGEGCKKPCRNEADFVYISSQILLYERTGWHFGDTNGLKDSLCISVAYLDSHIETIRLRNSGSKYITTPAPSAGEPAYFNCKLSPDGQTPLPLAEDKQARYIDPGQCWDKF